MEKFSAGRAKEGQAVAHNKNWTGLKSEAYLNFEGNNKAVWKDFKVSGHKLYFSDRGFLLLIF